MDIQFAHNSIDSGCDLIIGHHPHVIQPKEKWSGKNIYYSLGNFYFGSHRSVFPYSFTNQTKDYVCDYGLGVVLDLDTMTLQDLLIKYNRETDTSEIICENLNEWLQDISNVNWNCKEYEIKARNHSGNTNPILGLNSDENAKMIRNLLFKHWCARKLRFLKSFGIGQTVYNYIKHKVG